MDLVTEREAKAPASMQATTVRRLAREAGVLIGVGGQAGNVLRLQPPLTIDDAQIERELTVVDDALRQVAG